MPAIASLEDLKAAQKVEPHGKARQSRDNAVWGDIPASVDDRSGGGR